MGFYFLPVIFTAALAYLLVPLVQKIALRFNIVDNPQARKLHKMAIPLLGGLSIYIAFVVGLLLFYRGVNDLNLKGVIFGGTLMLLVGYWDDRVQGIPWKVKLWMQIIVTFLAVWLFGIKISLFDVNWLNFAISVFWIVGISNAINLMDNMDGLAAGISGIAAFFYFLLAHKAGQYDLALFAILLAVSCFAFLKYNFSPASIFMGDAGSMFLGFSLGCIAIQLQVTELWNWKIVADYIAFGDYQLITSIIPVLVLALPVFDTTLVSVLRILNGLKISTPGKDHSSHRIVYFKGRFQRLLDRFILYFIRKTNRKNKAKQHISYSMSQTRAVLILYGIAIIFGISALIISQLRLFDAIILLIILTGLILFGAKKLAEISVYEK